MYSALRLFLLLCVCAATLPSCNPHRHYMAVAPSMTQDEVKDTMGQRPTAFIDYGAGYVTWQYGDNYCILFKDNAVISKNIMRSLAAEAASRNEKTSSSLKNPARCPLPKISPSSSPSHNSRDN